MRADAFQRNPSSTLRQAEIYVQSIIGATEKRRESGAGLALFAGIGNMQSVRLMVRQFIRIALVRFQRVLGLISPVSTGMTQLCGWLWRQRWARLEGV